MTQSGPGLKHLVEVRQNKSTSQCRSNQTKCSIRACCQFAGRMSKQACESKLGCNVQLGQSTPWRHFFTFSLAAHISRLNARAGINTHRHAHARTHAHTNTHKHTHAHGSHCSSSALCIKDSLSAVQLHSEAIVAASSPSVPHREPGPLRGGCARRRQGKKSELLQHSATETKLPPWTERGTSLERISRQGKRKNLLSWTAKD
eukprot:1158155-Pelagomonas_calceolata.AAC.1